MSMLDPLTSWLSANPHWLHLSIFIVAFLECLALVGIILPGVVLMMAITALAGAHQLPLWQVIAAAWLGGLLGDILSFWFGQRFKTSIAKLPLIRTHPEWLSHAQVYFERFGAISLLIGRFIGPLRPILPMTAGMLDMSKAKFIAISLLAALGWAIAYSVPGWLVGAALDHPTPEHFWPEALSVLTIVCCLIGLASYGSLRQHRWASITAAIACLLSLLALVIGWRYLAVFDLHLHQSLQLIRSSGLDRFMVQLTKLADIQTQVPLIGLICSTLWLLKRYRAALYVGLVTLSATVLNTLLKHLITRPRPELLIEPLSGFSFPSGHTAAGFALCLALGVLAGREQIPRGRLIWLAIAAVPACLIAISRVYLGAHWPTDVIAGAILASLSSAVWLAIMQWEQPMAALDKRQWSIVGAVMVFSLLIFTHWNLAQSLVLYQY